MSLRRVIDRTLFWWRNRRMSRDINTALAVRKYTRPARQKAARKGADTRFQHRMEGLKR